MAKAVVLNTRAELIAQHSNAVEIGLITITPFGGGPDDEIRICTDATVRFSLKPLAYGLISRGLRYDAFPMRLVLPGSSKDELPKTSLDFDNIDPAMIQALEMSPFRATLSMETVLSTDLDTPLDAFPKMKISHAHFDDDLITLKAGYGSDDAKGTVKHKMDVRTMPALRQI